MYDSTESYTRETTNLRRQGVSKLTIALLGIIAVLLAILVVVLVFDIRFYTAESESKPVVVVSQTATPDLQKNMESFWKNRNDRLSLADQVKLRSQTQVYNLAYISDSAKTIQYYSTSIAANNPAWHRAEETPHLGTAYIFNDNFTRIRIYTRFLNYRDIWLNVYEPFVTYHDPTKIYMVVPDGTVWVIDMSTTEESILIPEAEVESSSGINIPLNPYLSL